MVKVQVTVTPSEAKRLIARAIAQMPVVRKALENGRILLKGGTTVSAAAEELTSTVLRISGRITPRGTKTANTASYCPHRVVIESGRVRAIDSDALLEETGIQMGKDDVLITGANALDVNRKAAVMVGHPLGGQAKLIPAIIARGVPAIIAVGWEKLIPCTIEQAAAAAGREGIDMAMGMAVGLIPLQGTVVTETDAVGMLAEVTTTVIGAGGILGGEGSTTFVIQGERSQVKKAWEAVSAVKGAALSGEADTLTECEAKCPRCSERFTVGQTRKLIHQACVYRQPGLAKKVFSER